MKRAWENAGLVGVGSSSVQLGTGTVLEGKQGKWGEKSPALSTGTQHYVSHTEGGNNSSPASRCFLLHFVLFVKISRQVLATMDSQILLPYQEI